MCRLVGRRVQHGTVLDRVLPLWLECGRYRQPVNLAEEGLARSALLAFGPYTELGADRNAVDKRTRRRRSPDLETRLNVRFLIYRGNRSWVCLVRHFLHAQAARIEHFRFGLQADLGGSAAISCYGASSTSGCRCGRAWRIGGSVMETPNL